MNAAVDFDFGGEEAPQPPPRQPAPTPASPDRHGSVIEFRKGTPPRARGREGASADPVNLSREMPYSEEAEQHVIACCLLDGSDTIDRAADAGIKPESFYQPANRQLFAVINELHAALKPKEVNLEILAQELKNRRLLEAVGGFPYLMQVTGRIPTTAHAGYFIEKIREKHVLREMIKANTSAVEQAYIFTGGLQEYVDDIRKRVEAAARGAEAVDLLVKLEYNGDKRLKKPDELYTLRGTCICTRGNITTLYAQVKVGKSAATGAMMASTMTVPENGADCLGFDSKNYEEAAVIHLDTEQSPYDHQNGVDTILKRAGRVKAPKWFHSYCLTGKSAAECRTFLHTAMRAAKRKHNRIHSVFIDGGADLVMNPNNPDESFPFVTELHSLAIEYDCAIVIVLHENPVTDKDAITKGRGHLGSQLERKSETNLRLEKEDGVTAMFSTKQRGKPIPKDGAPSFSWSDDKGMHASCNAPAKPAKAAGKAKFVPQWKDLAASFPAKDRPGRAVNELVRALVQNMPMTKEALMPVLQQLQDEGYIIGEADAGGTIRYRKAV